MGRIFGEHIKTKELSGELGRNGYTDEMDFERAANYSAVLGVKGNEKISSQRILGKLLMKARAIIQAAIDESITNVPAVVMELPDEVAALQYAMSLQTKRRSTSDRALYLGFGGFDTTLIRPLLGVASVLKASRIMLKKLLPPSVRNGRL